MASSTTETLHAAVKTFTNQLSSPRYKDHDSQTVTAAALVLIRQLPVARNAVLSYFGRRFDDAANRYLQAQVDRITGNNFNPNYSEESINASLKPIATSFQELIEDKSWAPQLSKWAIDLLGHISKKLLSTNAGPLSTSVNTVEEKLELWMSCSATKVLIEITANCFSALVDNSASVDGCVESLLDASVRYAPHFDWVVAHLGSCFPVTIIDRVLVAGFKDFFGQSSKFASASSILAYLSAQHKEATKQCVSKYFQSVLNQPPPGAAAAVTYLLNVASGSPMMIKALTSHLLSTMNVQTLNKLAAHFTVGTHDFASLLRLTVHLILRLDQTALATTNLLVDLVGGHIDNTCDHEPLRPEVGKAAKLIVNNLSEELEKVSVCSRVPNRLKPELPYLKHITLTHRALITRLHKSGSEEGESHSICRLLMSIAWQAGRHTAISILLELLYLKRPWLVCTYDNFLQQMCTRYPNILECLASLLFSGSTLESTYLKNISLYIASRTETADLLAQELTSRHLDTIGSLVFEFPELLTLLTLLCTLINRNIEIQTSLLNISYILVTCFLEQLRNRCYQMCNTIQNSLLALCRKSKSILCAILRTAVTKCMEQPYAAMFGVMLVTTEHNEEAYESLDETNSRLLKRLQLPATKSYILHTEYIGNGKRHRNTRITKDEVFCASQHLLGLITACCEEKCVHYTEVDAKMLLASVIVEFISPDTIASTTQWFEPITNERELAVKRALDDYPIVWHLLSYVSNEKVCFQAIQLLVRCSLCTITTAWGNCRDTAARNLPKEYETSQRLISLLLQAELLPSPLDKITLLLPHISTYEVKVLFEIIYRVAQSTMKESLKVTELEHDDLKLIQTIVQQNIEEVSDICSYFLQAEV